MSMQINKRKLKLLRINIIVGSNFMSLISQESWWFNIILEPIVRIKPRFVTLSHIIKKYEN